MQIQTFIAIYFSVAFVNIMANVAIYWLLVLPCLKKHGYYSEPECDSAKVYKQILRAEKLLTNDSKVLVLLVKFHKFFERADFKNFRNMPLIWFCVSLPIFLLAQMM